MTVTLENGDYYYVLFDSRRGDWQISQRMEKGLKHPTIASLRRGKILEVGIGSYLKVKKSGLFFEKTVFKSPLKVRYIQYH